MPYGIQKGMKEWKKNTQSKKRSIKRRKSILCTVGSLKRSPKKYRFKRHNVCIRKCVLDEEMAFCTGCGRTLEEISNWFTMSDKQKDKSLKRISKKKRNKN